MESPPSDTLHQIELIKIFIQNQHILDIEEIENNNLSLDFEGDSTMRFSILIGLVLGSQTRDSVMERALSELCKNGNLTPYYLQTLSVEKIENIIHSVSFSHSKASSILSIAKICISKYNGDIPQTYDELITLPGVGPKIATLTMSLAWNKVLGLGIDVHAHRVCNRIGWVSTKRAEQTDKQMQQIIPKELWSSYGNYLTLFGKHFCKSKKALCFSCPISSDCLSFTCHSK